MPRQILTLLFLGLITTSAMASDGLINVSSEHSVHETTNRLVNILTNKGMTVFKRINHAEGAKKVGKSLRPTELVIFGNPKVGTPLMLCSQSIAIDLPQKALIWENESGQVWLTYNDPQYLAARHKTTGCDKVLNKVAAALGKFARKATAKE